MTKKRLTRKIRLLVELEAPIVSGPDIQIIHGKYKEGKDVVEGFLVAFPDVPTIRVKNDWEEKGHWITIRVRDSHLPDEELRLQGGDTLTVDKDE